MAKFPYSYGSIELTKYPKAQYLNVTLPGETKPEPCIVLPYSEKWMDIYTDANGVVHARVNVNIDDAEALSNYIKKQREQENKQHTDFQAQIHISPSGAARKAWQADLEGKYGLMTNDELDKEAAKLRLSKENIAQSDYYRQHPDRIPTREQIVTRLAQNEIQRVTAAGRIYAPDLVANTPVPTATATATSAIPPAPQVQPSTQANQQPSAQAQHYASMLGGGQPVAPSQDDDLPF